MDRTGHPVGITDQARDPRLGRHRLQGPGPGRRPVQAHDPRPATSSARSGPGRATRGRTSYYNLASFREGLHRLPRVAAPRRLGGPLRPRRTTDGPRSDPAPRMGGACMPSSWPAGAGPDSTRSAGPSARSRSCPCSASESLLQATAERLRAADRRHHGRHRPPLRAPRPRAAPRRPAAAGADRPEHRGGHRPRDAGDRPSRRRGHGRPPGRPDHRARRGLPRRAADRGARSSRPGSSTSRTRS